MLVKQELISKIKDYFDLNIYETKVWKEFNESSIPHEFFKYVGNYLINDKFKVEILKENDELYLVYEDQPRLQLFYEGKHRFFAIELKIFVIILIF